MSGKVVQCPCGKKLQVPVLSSAAPKAAPPTAQREKVVVACACGKRLSAPESARGKAVRCPCGNTVSVPYADEVPSVAVAASAPANDSWLNDLPDHSSNPFDSNPAAAYGYSAPLAAPYSNQGAAYGGSPQPSAPAMSQAIAHSHLANAQQSLAYERQRAAEQQAADSGSSFFNSGTIGGLATMGIAVAWFVGGLMVGIIFFYPPVLFIIGLVTFAKGCFNND